MEYDEKDTVNGLETKVVNIISRLLAKVSILEKERDDYKRLYETISGYFDEMEKELRENLKKGY